MRSVPLCRQRISGQIQFDECHIANAIELNFLVKDLKHP